jgi:hypothetical protein
MQKIRRLLSIITVVMILAAGTSTLAEERQGRRIGAYLVVEGNVSTISARMLTIDGQQYPVSMFAQVFMGDENGAKMPLSILVNVGKIDRGRLYILGGKVEKIIVLKNL